MKKNGKRKVYLFFIFLLFIAFLSQIYYIYNLPTEIDIIKGETKEFNIKFPFTLNILKGNDKIVKVQDNQFSNIIDSNYNVKSFKNGKAEMHLKLLGLLSIKKLKVNIINRLHLIPGGDAIGVKLNTRGVLIVSLSEIEAKDGRKHKPAGDAGLKIGDVLLEIDGIKVINSNHVTEILNKIKNNDVTVKIERNGNIFSTTIKPIKSNQDNCYRIGLWVRDKTAGIGTLTFYHVESKRFGALGHGITDLDTGKLMPIDDGEIIKAKVNSIKIGERGKPGEIKGIFIKPEVKIGKIEKNSKFGIYGIANESSSFYNTKPLPVATQDEVKIGKAYILSTTDDNKVKKYEVNILKKTVQTKPNQKSLVIKVIDKDLIRKTGGIVQGMSGSPIIQDGCIIGAVTHVFVNDPTKGYGIYIEWMIKEAGIDLYNNKNFAIAN